jgi:hypothetical protein
VHSSAKDSGATLLEAERECRTMSSLMQRMRAKREEGAIGYILLWALGVPIPILVIIALVRGCA